MIDLKRQGGFCLRDRFEGLDLDHFKLVVEGQATLHAVSWAYKQVKGQKLVEMYPFLDGEGLGSAFEQYMEESRATVEKEIEMFKSEPKIHDGLRHLHTVIIPTIKLYFSIPLSEHEQHFTKDSVIRKQIKGVENEGKIHKLKNLLRLRIIFAMTTSFLSVQNHGTYCVMEIAGTITFYSDMTR